VEITIHLGGGGREDDRSRGIPLRPESRNAVVLLTVLQVLSRYTANEGVRRVAVGKERTNGQEDF